jgi:phage major tail protein 2|nr:MAG TPA: tail tube protein [Caudoviricetes sp.]
MANQIIKGEDLMLFDEQGKSLAFATSHTFKMNGDVQDISSKDHGIFAAKTVSKISWEMSSENLYTAEQYGKLFEKMIAREAITVFFGLKKEHDPEKTVADGDLPNWSGDTGCYTGKVLITALESNANNGDNATYSVTLVGTGKISKATQAPGA